MSIYFENELKAGGSMLCPCGCGKKPTEKLISRLDNLREVYGKPIHIETGAVCIEYSKDMQDIDPISPHINGNAVQINAETCKTTTDFMSLISLAVQMGFNGIGIGTKWMGAGYNDKLHLDIETDKNNEMRGWCYE